MTILQHFKEMERRGTLKELIMLGVLDWKWHRNYEIFLWVDKELRVSGKKKSQVVAEAADKFSVQDRAIYKVLRLFDHEDRGTDTDKG